MIPDNNDFYPENDISNGSDQERFEDLNNADAAKYNADEFERSVADRDVNKTRNTDSNTDEVIFNSVEQEQAVDQRERDEAANVNIAQAPLTTQGDEKEIEENMGGTTNLTLDQLKKEHDPEGTNNR